MYGIAGSSGVAAVSAVAGTQTSGPLGVGLAATGAAFALYVVVGLGLIAAGAVLRFAGRRRPSITPK